MKKLILFTFLLTGCTLFPSKWDQNQARIITDIRQEIGSFNCKQDQLPQIVQIEKNIEWFNYYAEFKKSTDLEHMMDTLHTTTIEYINRLGTGAVSPEYCEIKKELMLDQVGIIGSTMKGS
jgi:hypothetical protein